MEKVQEKLIEKKILNNNEKLEELKSLLEIYSVGNYLYPGILIAQLDISAIECYKILSLLEEMKIVEKSFEEYCRECKKVNGKIHDSFAEIPEEIYCKFCGRQLDPIDDVIVIYRVIKDE
ncbi:TPA: hypothetical protein ACF2DS_000148 [Clostridium perfringens]|uniref:hypothetical protein n=1 Tax=Clostridium perfringens TaxID=1502 RepID=UPI0036AAEB48